MSVIVKPANPAPIGVENVHVATVTDSTEGVTFGKPRFLSKTLKITLTPVTNTGMIECDDGVDEEETILSAITASIELKQLPTWGRQLLLGHGIDADGGIVTNKDDVAKDVALLFDVPLSKKKGKKYVVLYKGHFSEPTEEFETAKRDGITYKTNTIEGTFYPLEANGDIRYSIRSDDENVSAEKIANWFEEVQVKNGEVLYYTEPTEPTEQQSGTTEGGEG